MEIKNEYVDLEELDYKYGIDDICAILDFMEERVVMLSSDNYNNKEIAYELNVTIKQVEEIKETAINKIVSKYGRG